MEEGNGYYFEKIFDKSKETLNLEECDKLWGARPEVRMTTAEYNAIKDNEPIYAYPERIGDFRPQGVQATIANVKTGYSVELTKRKAQYTVSLKKGGFVVEVLSHGENYQAAYNILRSRGNILVGAKAHSYKITWDGSQFVHPQDTPRYSGDATREQKDAEGKEKFDESMEKIKAGDDGEVPTIDESDYGKGDAHEDIGGTV